MESGTYIPPTVAGLVFSGDAKGESNGSVEANVQGLERELMFTKMASLNFWKWIRPLYNLMESKDADPASNRAQHVFRCWFRGWHFPASLYGWRVGG